MFDTTILKEVAHDIEQLSELGENQHLVTRCNHLGQHAVQQFELAARHPDPIRDLLRVTI